MMKLTLINISYLESVAGGEISIIREIVEIFKTQVPDFISEMRSLLDKKDFHNLGLLAHKAKSSIAIMGMEELALMLKEFEISAREGVNTEKYPLYITRFEKDTEAAIKELDNYLKNQLV